MPQVTIYTDGSALGNPGKGGYGAVLLSPPYRKEMSAGYKMTTNNRMELLAVIVALEALKFDGTDVTLYSDSQYVVNAVEKGWLFGWEKSSQNRTPTCGAFLKVYRRHNAVLYGRARNTSIPCAHCLRPLRPNYRTAGRGRRHALKLFSQMVRVENIRRLYAPWQPQRSEGDIVYRQFQPTPQLLPYIYCYY